VRTINGTDAYDEEHDGLSEPGSAMLLLISPPATDLLVPIKTATNAWAYGSVVVNWPVLWIPR
jgi:hypothetical protein